MKGLAVQMVSSKHSLKFLTFTVTMSLNTAIQLTNNKVLNFRSDLESEYKVSILQIETDKLITAPSPTPAFVKL